jgi:hypothetical protein
MASLAPFSNLSTQYGITAKRAMKEGYIQLCFDLRWPFSLFFGTASIIRYRLEIQFSSFVFHPPEENKAKPEL